MALERELATYRRVLPELLADPALVNRFVLIHADIVANTFATFNEAVKAGYQTFGLDPFLVKPIVEREEPIFFPRSLGPCPS